MSSLLFPVGPLPPRVYWIRRLVVLGLPLVLIAAIAASCSGGGSPSAGAAGGHGPTSTPASSHSPSANAACVAGELSATLTTSAPGDIYQVGQSPVFIATITNVSASPCQFTSNPANEIWTVITGADKFWTTAGCPAADTSASTKSLAPGASQKITITWDGKRLDPGCTHGSPAQPGTYRLHARLDGVPAKQVIFHFHTNTG
jgi:hypothetical protein